MTEQIWCKIRDGAIVARRLKDNPEVADGPDGLPGWRPLTQRGDPPAFNTTTHYPPSPVTVINDTTVVESWQSPVAKTAQEMSDEAEALKDSHMAQFDLTSKERALFQMCFVQENRIRVLESRTELTVQQFRNYVRGIL